jgi:DNA-binding transcriptional LysR family regulator
MELRHLRYFVAVAEELNVRQTATRLHLSQPPLSRQIHDLEEEVGTKLFVRSQSGMHLTEAGRTFLTEARLILAHSQRAVQLAQAASRGEAGHLESPISSGITAGSSFGQAAAPEIVSAVVNGAPAVAGAQDAEAFLQVFQHALGPDKSR